MTEIDRAAIFSKILTRQALRRESHLPLLDVRAEFKQAVEQAAWKQHRTLNLNRVRTEILVERRQRHGASWPSSWGGRMALAALVQQALRTTFRKS